jgi:hypothetical protein
VKVDQFRTYLAEREFPDRQMLKLVGPETIERLGRQLVALHQSAKVDWAARFGQMAVEHPAGSEQSLLARRPWLVKFDGRCSNCGTVLTKGTEAIWRQRERRMLCLDCGAA